MELQRIAYDVLIEVDPIFFSLIEVDLFIGNPTKAKEKIGWKPIYDLEGLLINMVKSDVMFFQKDVDLKQAGYKVLMQVD